MCHKEKSMRVNSISFKGGYRETSMYIGNPDKRVMSALDNARPYLEHIGNSLPYSRELVVHVSKNNENTIVSAYDYNMRSGESKLLAKGNEESILSNGLNFVTRIFQRLEKTDAKTFRKAACSFVKKLDEIEAQKPNVEFAPKSHSFEWDPNAASC